MDHTFTHGNEVVVCLYDGHYHLGVAALTNSLVASNFEGIIHVGYRGQLPPWVNQLNPLGDEVFEINKNITLHFNKVDTDMHLAFYKPFFIKETMQRFPAATKFFYFDADIVVAAPWIFFSNWLVDEVCLCLDNSFGYVHQNHPWRKDWKKLAKMDKSFSNPMIEYVNSGFIGIKNNKVEFIDKWIELTNCFHAGGGNRKVITQEGHNSFKGDQDLLNAVITVSPEIRLSLIGTEGMGFKQPAYLMTHAIVPNKPWKKNFLRMLFKNGNKPTNAERNFFKFCKYPIVIFSRPTYFIKKVNLVLANALGRYLGN